MILAEIPAGGAIYDVQAGFDSVWIDNYQSNEVLRVDPERAEIVHREVVGHTIYGLAVTPEGVWAASQVDAAIVRIDPATNEVVTRIVDPHPFPTTFAYTDGALWVTHTDGFTGRIDPGTNTVVSVVQTSTDRAPGDPEGLAGAAWFPDRTTGLLARVDPASDLITAQVSLGEGYSVAQAGFDDLWVLNFAGEQVARIRPALVR